MAELIGRGRCPLPGCGSAKARYSLSSKGLVCVTCDRCNMQLFTRSEISDELARAVLGATTPAPAPEPAPAPPAPAPAPAIDPAPAPTPAPAAKPGGWGFLRA
jgi:hypothetical protein